MSNPNPVVPIEAGKATRFRAGYDPRRVAQRLAIQYICDRLSDPRLDDGRNANDDIVDHLVEVATKWEVVVLGKDQDGELLRVASARDSVAAAKLLWSYAHGNAPASAADEEMAIAEHMRKVARDGADLAIKILGTRIYSMGPKELAEFFRECGGNPAGFLEAAKCAEQVRAPDATLPDATLPDAPEEAQEPSAPVLPDSDDGWPRP